MTPRRGSLRNDPPESQVTDSDPAKFAQITRNLKVLADQLLKQHADYPVEEFGRALAAVAVSLLLDEVGDGATADWLRALAAELESRDAPECSASRVTH